MPFSFSSLELSLPIFQYIAEQFISKSDGFLCGDQIYHNKLNNDEDVSRPDPCYHITTISSI